MASNAPTTCSPKLLQKPVAKSISVIDFVATFLRAARLRLVSAATTWKSPEEPKVALYKHRGISAVHALLHLPSLAGAIVLLVWNINGRYVGSVSSSALTSLQFAAKLFEVLMQVSLGVSLLAHIRHEAMEHTVYFGSLLAPL